MTPRYLVLSHPLRANAPVWPGNPPAALTQAEGVIARGDDSNRTHLRLFSHSGTHVDTPWHFNPAGPAAWQLPIERFVFHSPRLVAVPTPAGSFIDVSDLEPHAASIAEADLVLLYTGWSRLRDEDPQRYVHAGPLLHPDAAGWLIDRHPRLGAIAIDAISIGSPRHPEPSVKTHRVLAGVGRRDGRNVLIYEDLAFDERLTRASRVFAWPLLIEDADGSPCTIVAELDTDR
jgi:kynurenine formamidase